MFSYSECEYAMVNWNDYVLSFLIDVLRSSMRMRTCPTGRQAYKWVTQLKSNGYSAA